MEIATNLCFADLGYKISVFTVDKIFQPVSIYLVYIYLSNFKG